MVGGAHPTLHQSIRRRAGKLNPSHCRYLDTNHGIGTRMPSNELQLSIPAHEHLDAQSLNPAPRHLAAWLASFRVGEYDDAAERLLDVLRKYNRCPMKPGARYQFLDQLQLVLREYIDTLSDRLSGNTYPLADKPRAKFQLIAALIQESAYGYKQVIDDLIQSESKNTSANTMLVQSLYHAVMFLSDRLLAAYSAYLPEPEGVWGELHRLYRFAEQHDLLAASISMPETLQSGGDSQTIKHAYKRIVLLYLANPYHLMSGEAGAIYLYLNAWATHGRLLAAEQNLLLDGKYLIDLAQELPPQYSLQNRTPSRNSDLRVLDVSRLVEHIGSELNKYTEPQPEPEPGITSRTLRERLHRDMLQRLEHAWGGRRARQDERMPNSADIVIAAGMSASHYFVSNELAFTPELDEVRIHRPGGVKQTFSLVPIEDEPWRAADKLDKLAIGVAKPRLSQFSGAEDLWEKIYASKENTGKRAEDVEQDFTAQLWRQINSSNGGMGMSCDGRGKRIRVGDVVVLKFVNNLSADWKPGIVRWLRDVRDEQLEIGIMVMTGNLQPVAVRSIDGVGSGGEYFRSLIISEGATAHLLVPSAIYDVGTCLVLNRGEDLLYVRLVRMHEATASFSRFEYEVIATPPSEQQNIEALRAE